MKTIKEWLNARVWANGAIKEDIITQQELLQIVTNCIAATQPQWISVVICAMLTLIHNNGLPYDC